MEFTTRLLVGFVPVMYEPAADVNDTQATAAAIEMYWRDMT